MHVCLCVYNIYIMYIYYIYFINIFTFSHLLIVWRCMRATVHMWMPDDNLQETNTQVLAIELLS